jgi:hypothetical protein
MTVEEAQAAKKKLEARLDRQQKKTAKKTKPLKSSNETTVVEATPTEAEEVKQRDLARAKERADELRLELDKASTSANEGTEQKLETTPDETKQQPRKGDRRESPNQRGADRAKVSDVKTGLDRTPAPQRSSRRKRGSDRRSRALPATAANAAPGVTTPPVSQATQDLAKQLEATKAENRALGGSEAKKTAAPVETPETVVKEADTTSRAATSTVDTKAAVGEGFTAWSEDKLKNASVEERLAYQRQLESHLGQAETGGLTAAEKAARKKAANQFYRLKTKKIEEAGSARKGTSTAVNPAVAGAEPVAEAVTPPPRERPAVTDELLKKQGVTVRKIEPKTAPEADATTDEWNKKQKNKDATRTPLEQAKLNAEELGLQISETETRTGTVGEKIKAAGTQADTLTADVAEFEGKRIVQSTLNNEGEFETKILERDALEKTIVEAQEDLRSGEERRSGEATRRTFGTRSTAAEASKMVTESDRPPRPGESKPAIGSKKSSRREKQTGGDRRQKGSTWKPVNVADEVAALQANKRPGGKSDRRRRSLLDLDVGELKDSAARGDPIAVETLEQYRKELKGRDQMRRGTEPAVLEQTRLDLDVERIERGTPESTSVWDPKAKHRVPTAQMDVNADLMPEARVYDGDPIKRQSLETMDKNIENLRKRINAPGAPVLHKGEETLAKLIRRRNGLSQEIETAKTRQFPTMGAERAEGAQVPGEKVIPRTEARKHLRGESGVRDVLVEGKPQDRATAPPRGPIKEPRTRPHVGPERGTATRPAPDLTVKTPAKVSKPVVSPPLLTSPSIGSNLGANIWDTVKKGVKRGFKPKNIARGASGFAAVTALFAAPEIASAYVDASGTQRDRIKAAGGESLESGIAVGTGMALFTGGLLAAKKAAPQVLKPLVGAAGHAAGSAAIGWAAGTAAGDVYNRVKRVSDKNKRDAAFAQEKYGTVEAATRTRKHLKADGKPMTLDDTEEIAKRWEREQAKLNKRRGAKE